MASLHRAMMHGTATTDVLVRAQNALVAVGAYLVLYLGLDWLSFIDALPATSFTPWNPPPACSLALLLSKGSFYAPALFAVGVISDGLITGFHAKLIPSLLANIVIAAGYTAVATALQRLFRNRQGLQNVTDVGWFLSIVAFGVLAIAGAAAAVFVQMHVLPSSSFLSAVGHFWIGDVAGITGLLPALMNVRSAHAHWKELMPSQRLVALAAFTTGLVLSLFIVFGIAGHQAAHSFYLILLPVVWIAVRHGLPWSTMAVLVTQLVLIATVVALDYTAEEFLAFQFLSLTMSCTGLVVGAVVSERQRAEADLRRQQAELDRMERATIAGALGMAVAHQISQPLATIATYTHACRQLLHSDLADRKVLAEAMAKAEAAVLRTGAIVDRLRDFLSKGDRHLSPVDMVVVIREIVSAMADEANRHGIDLQIHTTPTPPIMADRVQIEQVLINLVRNAIDALAGQVRGKKNVRVLTRALADVVEVAIEDNGPGVSPDLAERLFQPFETSKRNGMGLGLWLSRELIKGHGGCLWLDADTARGARFVFCLPRR